MRGILFGWEIPRSDFDDVDDIAVEFVIRLRSRYLIDN